MKHPYGFPLAPYEIQSQFMAGVHTVLDDGAVGFLESPTGTGKTLSLICGTLSWLRKHLYESPALTERKGQTSEDPLEAYKLRMQREAEQEEREAAMVHRRAVAQEMAKQRMTGQVRQVRHKRARVDLGCGDEMVLREEDDRRGGKDDDDDDDDDDDGMKKSALQTASSNLRVFYTSRTHSQLSQFCEELRKTEYFCRAATVESKEQMMLSPQIWTVSLGSRSGLCVYEPVRKLSSQSAINDACQRKRESKEGCECNKAEKVEALAVECLSSGLVDVEEIFKMGQRRNACSYYASRTMMRQCDLVVLPYQMLMHEKTRVALGLDLKNSVVIIDEAHNLVDAINSVHSASLSVEALKAASLQLAAYFEAYREELSPSNVVFVRELQLLLSSMAAYMAQRTEATKTNNDSLKSVNEFMTEINCENINIFPLVAKIEESNISNILRGFNKQVTAADDGKEGDGNAFYKVAHFLECLTFRDVDGRILVRGSKSVDFLLLSPQSCFERLASQCRAVLLAGGTLSPIDWMTNQLISSPELRARVRSFSFGHVVSPDRVLLMPLAVGPMGKQLNFTLAQRDSEDMQKELLAVLTNVRRITPGGLVVFFSSYAFQESFFAFASRGEGGAEKKLGPVFRSAQGEKSSVFEAYAGEIRSGSGRASLWSVVGGSLSEGINFSDNLARAVVMVGVPFPNAKDVVLRERARRSSSPDAYLEALTARAVNQSIGRAIRHANDFACILLLDARYAATDGIAAQLPQWMLRSAAKPADFGAAAASAAAFFRRLQK